MISVFKTQSNTFALYSPYFFLRITNSIKIASIIFCRGKNGSKSVYLCAFRVIRMHSKTACRGFKSFCPCQTQKSEKRLKQAISRTFLFDISSKKSHGARSKNKVLTLKKSSRCSSGGNKSTVSVGYIIKISAVFGKLITKLFADL